MKRRNKTSPNSMMSATLKRDAGSALVAKRLMAAVTLAAALFATPAWAQNIDEAFLSASSPLARGEQLFLSGSYAAAGDAFLRAQGLDREEGIVGASRAFAMIGDRARAIALCEDALNNLAPADLPLVAVQLAELRLAQGESALALDVLADVSEGLDQPPLRAVVKYGEALQLVGRRGEAAAQFQRALDRYTDGLVFSSQDIGMVARASWLLGEFHDANSLFSEATRLDPNNLEAQTLWGDLFLEKFNAADAQRSYEDVLAVNPRYLPALTGLARVTGDRGALERALAVNPSFVPALETQAQLFFVNDFEDDALEAIDRALSLNPESLKSLSLLGAKAALEERTQDFAEIRARVDAFSPSNPQFLGDVADTLGRQYRFVEAVALAREAIASDPNYWQGYTLLGSNLIRLGEEVEGRENLEIGFDNDPFNVMTSNMLKVYDTLDSYVTVESEHFKVNLSEKDGQVLWPYLEPLLEESWDTLTAKYGFEPEGPILIQVFENSQDFAVRSVGLPDIGPLVGICFGKVITLISPDTLSANWQEIVWHEFAHVVTLQMTGNKLPRWLSEGISVWEEREGRPYWGRSQGLDLVRAWEQDKLLPFADLDKGFSGAQNSADLGFAYFQSYLVIDYIAREYGFEGLRSLVMQYDEIKTDAERFDEAFAVSLTEFDAGFLSWVEQRVSEIDVYVHKEDAPDEGEGHGHGVRENSSAILAELYNNTSLKQHMNARIEANPKDFQAYLQMGIVLFKEEAYAEATIYLDTAYAMLPEYTGYPSPPLVLAQIYEKEGNEAARLEQLRLLLGNQQHDYNSAITLAEAAFASSDLSGAGYYIDRAIQVDPYRREVHELRARLASLQNDTAAAVVENEVIVTLEVDDPVEARTNLAEAYLNNGDTALAKRNVLSALEIAPSYLRAQKILLRTVAVANENDD